MKTLVTGGAGFIGSALCRLLLDRGESVVNLDKLTYAATPASVADLDGQPNYAFVHADVADAAAVSSVFREHAPEAVIHLAAETHVDRSIAGPADFLSTNITGTFVLLQAALEHWRGLSEPEQGRFRFLHVSTDEVFGSLAPEGLFTEETSYDPRSPYSASKAASDHLVRAWGHTYGLPVLVTNCSNNFGPRQFPEKLIPLTLIAVLEGRAAPVYGDGSNVRDWLYVDDHAAALALVRDRGVAGASYNVGARCEQRNLDLVRRLCDLVDEEAGPLPSGPRRNLITFVPDRPGHDRRYAIDPSKLETELGWRPQQRFDEALRATVRWYLDNRLWWEPLRARYAGERLGLHRPAS